MAAHPAVSIDVERSLGALSDAELAGLVCTLFSRCSHTQQVEIVEKRLPAYLQRDFLSLLPPEIVLKVLRYLEVGDMLTCLLVSRRWRQVISDCVPLWRHHCNMAGVSLLLIDTELHKYTSYMFFTLAVLKARNMVRTGRPVYELYPDKTGKQPNATLTCRPAIPSINGLFIGHEMYAGSDFGTYILSIRCLNEVQDLVELTSLPVSHMFVIIWSCSSPKYILVHGSDGSWIQTEIVSRGMHITQTHVWHGHIYNQAYYELSCCPQCCLVGVVNKMPRGQGNWDFLLLKLVSGYGEPQTVPHSFTFFPIEPNQNSVFFQIYKLALLPVPDTIHCEVDGFCRDHVLVVQFGACICLFSLKLEQNEDKSLTVVLENTCNLCPFDDLSYYTTPSILGYTFSLSADYKLAAYFVDSVFFVWNLDTKQLYGYRKGDPYYPTNADCIAVGYLFSIMYTYGTRGLRVLSTVTGESLLFHQIEYSGDNPVHAPSDQHWLNDLNVHGDKLSLAITLREWQNPGLLSLLVPD